MSYNGSGVAVINSAGQPVVASTTITSTAFNALTADLATMLSTCILKDGQQTITANIPFNSKKITGLGAGTARTDGASLATIQDGTGVYVGTVGGTADAITLTPSPAIAAYAAGQTFRFIASGANTTTVTVAVSGLASPKDVTKNGTTALAAGDIASGAMVCITYDGTRFILAATNTGILNAPTINGTVTGTYTLGGTPTFPDNIFTVSGSSDATKKIALEVDSLTTATTRTRYQIDEDSSEGQGWEIKNLTLTATVGASALTVAVKTKSGADASATNPILFKFRNDTLGTGDYATISLTAALSLVISSGSTLGTVSGVAHRLYVGICNDGGTLRLFLFNPYVAASLSILGLQDDLLYSSTAEGGAGAADSAQVLYSGTAFTTKAIRLLGYIESTQGTAGTWATTPSKIHLLKPWDKRTGDIIQRLLSQTGSVSSGTTTLPHDNTIPQKTEGDEFMSLAITPKSAINLLTIQANVWLSNNSAGTFHQTAALFQDTTANALAAVSEANSQNLMVSTDLLYRMLAGTTSATTLKIRAGCDAGNTTTFNGISAAGIFNGVGNSSLSIEEMMV